MGSFCSLSFLKCMQGAGEEGKKTTHCFGFSSGAIMLAVCIIILFLLLLVLLLLII